MAKAVDERMPEEILIQLLAKKANIIKDYLQNRQRKLTIVANIGPTMATFKLHDLSEEDSLRLHVTLSNLGDIDEQIHQLWQQVTFCRNNIAHIVSTRTLRMTINFVIYKDHIYVITTTYCYKDYKRCILTKYFCMYFNI